MRLLDRLRERRDRLHQQPNQSKGSIVFWYCALSLIIQLVWLFRSRKSK